MDNPVTQATLGIRHRKNTNNTKKNTTPNIKKDKHHGHHRKPGVNSGAREVISKWS